MNIKDLKIGISLYDSVRSKEVTIGLKHFREISISEKCFFDRYQPIVLTDDYLLEKGFERIIKFNGNAYVLGNLELWRANNGKIYNFVTPMNEGHKNELNLDMQYVHELENLMFNLKI